MENDNNNKDDLKQDPPKKINYPDNRGKRGSESWRPVYFDALVAYYADPSEQRTLKQWCIDNKLSEDTVHQYKREHGDVLFSTVDNVRAKYIPKIRMEAMRAVFSNIKKSFNDRKLALQIIGDLVERTADMTPIKTPGEKRALLAEALTKLSRTLDDKDK